MINHRTQKLHAQQVLEHLAYGLAQPIALPRETIEEVLREAIMDGRLEPGERLTQQAIANAFQVSRMPVREALRSLRRRVTSRRSITKAIGSRTAMSCPSAATCLAC